MKKLFLIFLFATFACCAIVAQVSKRRCVEKSLEGVFNPDKIIRDITPSFNRGSGIRSFPLDNPWRHYIQYVIQNGNKNGPKESSILKVSERKVEDYHWLKIRKNHEFPLSKYESINNNQPQKELINSGFKSLERGFIPEEHNIVSPNVSSVQEEGINEVQIEDSSQNWKEKLREKVLDKIHKINKIETKGNIYMIYGHIIKKYYDGECYINDAA